MGSSPPSPGMRHGVADSGTLNIGGTFQNGGTDGTLNCDYAVIGFDGPGFASVSEGNSDGYNPFPATLNVTNTLTIRQNPDIAAGQSHQRDRFRSALAGVENEHTLTGDHCQTRASAATIRQTRTSAAKRRVQTVGQTLREIGVQPCARCAFDQRGCDIGAKPDRRGGERRYQSST